MKHMDADTISSLTDAEIEQAQRLLSDEAVGRLRAVQLPSQLESVIMDARSSGHISDARIREVFESAMAQSILP